jgi:hypothetical protein
MLNSRKEKSALIIVLLFFAFYLIWLYRAYTDVVWQDQIQLLAGNIKHFYNDNLSLQDFYYRPPFLLFFSNLFVFINCKLFSYNTYIENIFSGIVLFMITIYFIRANEYLFRNSAKLYFILMCCLIVFGLHKWEMSLWSGGYSQYMVVFLAIVCMNMGHRYYLNQLEGVVKKYFVPIYLLLAFAAILEATSYFLPFQLSMLLLLFINYRFFRKLINISKWKVVLLINGCLLIFAFFINYFAEIYSANHAYDGYGKVVLSQSIGNSLHKVIADPVFVIKFFFLSNTGNIIDNESYMTSPFIKGIMPYIGFLVIAAYGYMFYIYIRQKKLEYLFSINLMFYTVIFYSTVLVGRLQFNDVYFGTSSRYSSATFTGILGLSTVFLLLLNQKKYLSKSLKLLFLLPVFGICICYCMTNLNQWKIAPYRKINYLQMAENLKADKNLEALQGYNVEITRAARSVMIKNKLNVFKPKTRLNNYAVKSDFADVTASGFYNVEEAENGSYRWTNGAGEIYLPSLYSKKDTIRVKLLCYMPQPDTPNIVLNDNLNPSSFKIIDGGYEYTFPIRDQKVFFRAAILNRSFVPHELNKDNADIRSLGLVFSLISFHD